MAQDRDPSSSVSPPGDDGGLQNVLQAAQRFLACRERAASAAPWNDARTVRTLAEAIERDFIGFDLERAEAELRAAVAALCGTPAQAARPPLPRTIGRAAARQDTVAAS